MNPNMIQDPEGAKTMVISFKTVTGAVAAVHRKTFKHVCFGDAISGRLKVDTTTTSRGKQYLHKQGRMSILI